MNVLLDTNAFMWLMGYKHNKIGKQTRAYIDGADYIYVSSISVAEITIKKMLGKLTWDKDTSRLIAASGLHELPLRATHAQAIQAFERLSRHDPFDRLLLAQAYVEGLVCITSDRTLLAQAGSGIVVHDIRL